MPAISISFLIKILIIFSMLSVCVIIHKWSKFKQKKLDLELYQININVNISDGIVLGKASIDIDELNKILDGLKND